MAVAVTPYRFTLHNVFVMLEPNILEPPLTLIGLYSVPFGWVAPTNQVAI